MPDSKRHSGVTVNFLYFDGHAAGMGWGSIFTGTSSQLTVPPWLNEETGI